MNFSWMLAMKDVEETAVQYRSSVAQFPESLSP